MKKITRRVTLHRETLRILASRQLHGVAGITAANTNCTCATVCQHSCAITDCYTNTDCC